MFSWIKSVFKRVAQSCAVRKMRVMNALIKICSRNAQECSTIAQKMIMSECLHELDYDVLGGKCKKCDYSSLADDYGMYD